MKSKKEKKIIKIVVLTFICLIVLPIVFFLGWFDSDFYKGIMACKFYIGFEEDYYKMEKSGFMGIDFSKYYYYQDSFSGIFMGRRVSKPVGDEVDSLKKYIDTSLDKLHELDNNIEIVFDYDAITYEDYYYVEYDGEVTVLYYYDTGEHILYRITSNIKM